MKVESVDQVDSLSAGLFATHYPNRIFVGSLPGKATATDLAEFFSQFGTVLEGKVVLDNCGRSRRFGFVTFATSQDVSNVLNQGMIFYRGRKINVGPAVKKMLMPSRGKHADVVSDDQSVNGASYSPSPPLISHPMDFQVLVAPPSPPAVGLPPMMMMVDAPIPSNGMSMVPRFESPPNCLVPSFAYHPCYMDSHSLPVSFKRYNNDNVQWHAA